MQGTSPFAYHTPSFHSSSYLPKMEANFMRDFSCCGLTLPSLHELLQHYEERHDQQTPSTVQKNTAARLPDNKAAIAAGAAAAVQERAQQQSAGPSTSRPSYTLPPDSAGSATPRHMQPSSLRRIATDIPSAPVLPAHDMDAVHDMEMDDEPTAMMNDLPSPFAAPDQSRTMQRTGFGQPPSTRVPPLDLASLNMGNPLQSHQGLRHSTPTTPVAPGRMGNLFHHNPTVSSVNTPTLMAHPRQQQQQYRSTPDSSVPASPNASNQEANSGYGQGPVSGNPHLVQDQYHRFGQYGFSNEAEAPSPCIDDPGKRLFSRDGGFNGLEQPIRLTDGAYGEDSELARTIREQQRLAGVPDPQLDDPDVPKPFHCPVIGCEKAYKNQNGLKYHKSVGHPLPPSRKKPPTDPR